LKLGTWSFSSGARCMFSTDWLMGRRAGNPDFYHQTFAGFRPQDIPKHLATPWILLQVFTRVRMFHEEAIDP
jgi:hypothetical protein